MIVLEQDVERRIFHATAPGLRVIIVLTEAVCQSDTKLRGRRRDAETSQLG